MSLVVFPELVHIASLTTSIHVPPCPQLLSMAQLGMIEDRDSPTTNGQNVEHPKLFHII